MFSFVLVTSRLCLDNAFLFNATIKLTQKRESQEPTVTVEYRNSSPRELRCFFNISSQMCSLLQLQLKRLLPTPLRNNNGALMLDCSGVSTAEPEPSVQTSVPSVQHTAGGNTANALYSATEETDLQDSGK